MRLSVVLARLVPANGSATPSPFIASPMRLLDRAACATDVLNLHNEEAKQEHHEGGA